MDRITLYEEFRLVERNESEINNIWKGAHLLLFFLAFVFGSFCTFCFHILMYLFDEKCVLFPKLLSITSLRQNIIYDFIPEEEKDSLPVDFLSTQWVEKSACYLPTYVPLVSGIFGLVWTTMYLMCSTGSRVLTGLQRPWRVLPWVFLFSLAMGGLCIYTTIVTQYGLEELCNKLSEITGSASCTFTVNVATLAYDRRIRGVYQAIMLTIVSAWLHTSCWLLSALLTVMRVLLVVDFQLVRIKAQLQGNIDRMLERHEMQIATVSPITASSEIFLRGIGKRYLKQQQLQLLTNQSDDTESGELIFAAENAPVQSELSLEPIEYIRLERTLALTTVQKKHRFIVKYLYELLDSIDLPESQILPIASSVSVTSISNERVIERQYGQQNLTQDIKESETESNSVDLDSPEESLRELKKDLERSSDISHISLHFPVATQFESTVDEAFFGGTQPFNGSQKDQDETLTSQVMTKEIKLKETLQDLERDHLLPSTSTAKEIKSTNTLNKPSKYMKSSTSQTKQTRPKKSNLKHVGVQTKQKGTVHIESRTEVIEDLSSTENLKTDKGTQTKNEKQD